MPLIFNIVDMICLFPKGNVSRDLLLQKISSTAQLSEAIHWGPACNRAVREIFPDTLAQRKGKFKKYPFHSIIRSFNRQTCTSPLNTLYIFILIILSFLSRKILVLNILTLLNDLLIYVQVEISYLYTWKDNAVNIIYMYKKFFGRVTSLRTVQLRP